jgi:hypothetical protein
MIRPSSPLTMLLLRHTRRREVITLLGVRRPNGRSRRTRNPFPRHGDDFDRDQHEQRRNW